MGTREGHFLVEVHADIHQSLDSAPLYYRGALAAILVYDCTNEASFNDIKIWLEGDSDSP